jgi:hypothetical protein
MGILYQQYGSYAAGLAALSVVAAAALLLTVTVVHRAAATRADVPAGA